MIHRLGPIEEPRKIAVGQCLAWVTRDPRWLSAVAIGGLWNLALLFVLPAVALLGYGARVLRASVRDESARLPSWRPFGPLVLDGVRVLMLMAVHYMIAALCLWSLANLLALPAVMGSDQEELAVGLVILAMTLGVPASLLFGLYLLTALGRAVALERLGAGFEVGQNLDFFRRNSHNYVRLVGVVIVASVLIQLSPILCCVGLFPAGFWVQCTLNYTLGRILALDQDFFRQLPAR